MTITGPIQPKYYADVFNPAPEAFFGTGQFGEIITCTRSGRMWMTNLGATGPSVLKMNPIASGWSPLLGELTIGWSESFNQFSGPTLSMTGSGTFNIEPTITFNTCSASGEGHNLSVTDSLTGNFDLVRINATQISGQGESQLATLGKPLHFMYGSLDESSGVGFDMQVAATGLEMRYKPDGTNWPQSIPFIRVTSAGASLPQLPNVPILATGASGVIQAGSLPSFSAAQPSSDVAISSAWGDIVSPFSLTTGKWMITAYATVTSDVNNTDVGVRIYNTTDSSYVASSNVHIRHLGSYLNCHLSAVLTVDGTKSVAFQAICPDGGTATPSANGANSFGIRYDAVRIG